LLAAWLRKHPVDLHIAQSKAKTSVEIDRTTPAETD